MFSLSTHTAVREPDGRDRSGLFCAGGTPRTKPGLPPFLKILQGRQQKVSGEAASQGAGGHTWSVWLRAPRINRGPRLGKHALMLKRVPASGHRESQRRRAGV